MTADSFQKEPFWLVRCEQSGLWFRFWFRSTVMIVATVIYNRSIRDSWHCESYIRRGFLEPNVTNYHTLTLHSNENLSCPKTFFADHVQFILSQQNNQASWLYQHQFIPFILPGRRWSVRSTLFVIASLDQWSLLHPDLTHHRCSVFFLGLYINHHILVPYGQTAVCQPHSFSLTFNGHRSLLTSLISSPLHRTRVMVSLVPS